jgi:hypothetical protein
MLHGIMPRTVADLPGLVNRLLPSRGGIGTWTARGAESDSALTPSVLTGLT